MNSLLYTPIPLLLIAATLTVYSMNSVSPPITILVTSPVTLTVVDCIPPTILYCTLYPVIAPLRSVQLTSPHDKLIAVELIMTGTSNTGAPLGGSVQ